MTDELLIPVTSYQMTQVEWLLCLFVFAIHSSKFSSLHFYHTSTIFYLSSVLRRVVGDEGGEREFRGRRGERKHVFSTHKPALG